MMNTLFAETLKKLRKEKDHWWKRPYRSEPGRLPAAVRWTGKPIRKSRKRTENCSGIYPYAEWAKPAHQWIHKQAWSITGDRHRIPRWLLGPSCRPGNGLRQRQEHLHIHYRVRSVICMSEKKKSGAVRNGYFPVLQVKQGLLLPKTISAIKIV